MHFPFGWVFTCFSGPFTSGKAEVDGDEAFAFGSLFEMARTRFLLDVDASLAPSFPSEFASEGRVSWSAFTQSNAESTLLMGAAPRDPPVDWATFVQQLDTRAALEWVGWAVGELSIH